MVNLEMSEGKVIGRIYLRKNWGYAFYIAMHCYWLIKVTDMPMSSYGLFYLSTPKSKHFKFSQMWMNVWISVSSVTNYVSTLWKTMSILVRKAAELEVMEKLASLSCCGEFYQISSNRLQPLSCSLGARRPYIL